MVTEIIIKNILGTVIGRQTLAKALTKPLMRRMNYASIARKVFGVRNLCWVCKKVTKSKKFYYEDFLVHKKSGDSHAPGELYRLCLRCTKSIKEKLKNLNALSIDQMPLYINDDSIFVRDRAIDRLKRTG